MHPCWHVPRIYLLSKSKKVVLVYICESGVGESIHHLDTFLSFSVGTKQIMKSHFSIICQTLNQKNKERDGFYFFFKYGRPVLLFTPTVYLSGLSQGAPLLGLFPALQK